MKLLTNLDLNKLELRNGVVHKLASAPSSPAEGQIYYNSVSKTFNFFDGTSWVSSGSFSFSLTGEVTGSLSGSTLAAVVADGVIDNANIASGAGIVDTKLATLTTTGKVANSATTAASANGASTIVARDGSGNFAAGTITADYVVLNNAPTSSNHAATKAYVDSVLEGLDVKKSVRAATTANITLTGTQTIDGVVLIAGNRVLVKNQTTGADNGFYLVASGAWTRTTDTDNSVAGELTDGAFTFVEEGTANAGTGWVLTTADPLTVGTTTLTFTQFSSAGVVLAGSELTKTGNTINHNASGVGASTYRSVTVNTYGHVTGGTNPTSLSGYGITDAIANYYTADVGDGSSTTITVTHSLGRKFVIVQLYDNSTGAQIWTDVTLTNTTTLSLVFDTAPTSAQYKVVVVG